MNSNNMPFEDHAVVGSAEAAQMLGINPPARSLTGGRRGEALHTCASGRAARPFCIAWEISNCGSNRVWLAAAKGRIRADPLVGRQRAKR